jgi:hypothetical protein
VTGRRAARRLLPPLLALVAFAAVASLLRPLVPWTGGYGIAARVRHFAEHRGDYDLLIFGSSALHNGLWPSRIDARLAARGHRVHSFNFATGGMSAYEMTFLLERMLALDPTRLRWVVMELVPWDPRLLLVGNSFTERVVFWHTPAVTLDVLAALVHCPGRPRDRIALGGLQLAHAAWRFANVGRGEDVAAAWLLADADRAGEERRVSTWRGFESADANPHPERERTRERFLRHLPAWRVQVRRLDAENAGARPFTKAFSARAMLLEADRRLLRKQVALVRERGARPLFLVPPITGATPGIYALEEEGVLPDLLGYNRPRRYPALYAEENRFDAMHLNERGAAAFSLLFADDFADWLER